MKQTSEEAQKLIAEIEANHARRVADLNKPFELTEFVATPAGSYDPLDEPDNDGCLVEACRTGLKMVACIAVLWVVAWHPVVVKEVAVVIGYGCLFAAFLLGVWIAFCLLCRKVNKDYEAHQELDSRAFLN